MTDRELLELAARAAGWGDDLDIVEIGGTSVGKWKPNTQSGIFWQPLREDGDALRLAVRCGLVIDTSRPSAGEPFKPHHFAQEDFEDPLAATRRAIVRAAAEIGKAMAAGGGRG